VQTFDRYLLRLFIRVLLVCLVSITGLYIVVDSCNNLDEFLGYGKKMGFLQVLAGYYGARVPWFFDRISGLLALVAAMFAVTWLQRSNEMTALLAAGIPKSRIVKPLIAAAIVVSLFAAANREFVIPANRSSLLRNAQDWLGNVACNVDPVRDYRTDILFTGESSVAREKRIERPSFRLHSRLGLFGSKITAENAYYCAATDEKPAGYLLDGVKQPQRVSQIPSAYLEELAVILSPFDTPWLEDDQCFVVSEINFDQLAGGTKWRQLASTHELLAGLRNPSLDYGLDARVTIHSRLVQPVLDMTLFFLGIPLVVTRESRNVFVAAGWCLLLVVGFFAIVLTCQALGNFGYLVGPALAAWLPVFLLTPCATAVASPIWD
jgi:lipopolysaccharide export system permease protein